MKPRILASLILIATPITVAAISVAPVSAHSGCGVYASNFVSQPPNGTVPLTGNARCTDLTQGDPQHGGPPNEWVRVNVICNIVSMEVIHGPKVYNDGQVSSYTCTTGYAWGISYETGF